MIFPLFPVQVDSHSSDVQIDRVSLTGKMTSSKYSETDYNQFVASLNEQNQQSYSTPEPPPIRVICHCSSNETLRSRTKSSSTTLLSTLLERYEKTLRERQQAMSIANEQLLDTTDLLKRYQGKIDNSLQTSTSNMVR